MADLTLQERLQPSLLDRLTDREPENNRESRDRRVLSVEKLRESVVRDLGFLLNTGSLEATEDLDAFPEVKKSVLNYGVPDLAGITVSSTDPSRLEDALLEAILTFEPRIIPETLKLVVEVDDTAANNRAVSFRLEGEVNSQPMPIALYLRTELDLETGNYSLSEASR